MTSVCVYVSSLLGVCRDEEGMNRVPLQQQQQQCCGLWELKERLGTGGFGNVTRWQNKVPITTIKSDMITLQINEKNNQEYQ